MLDKFSFVYGVSQVNPFPNTKRKERIIEAFCEIKELV